MSAAAAPAETLEVALPLKGGKKKLILIGAVVLALLLAAGAGTVLWLKSRAAHARQEVAVGEDGPKAQAAAKNDPANPPTFLPLDVFVVNLADRDADRYAQIGITFEVDSAVFADQMKAYMPAIRNAILMILAQKSSQDLLDRAGKEQLAEEIRRETVRPMGIDMPAPERIATQLAPDAARDDGANEVQPPRKKPARRTAPHNPVRHVHFSNFIIQ